MAAPCGATVIDGRLSGCLHGSRIIVGWSRVTSIIWRTSRACFTSLARSSSSGIYEMGSSMPDWSNPASRWLSLLPRRFNTRSPRGVECALIVRMLPTCSQLTVADLVYMDGAIFLLLAIARESLPGKNDPVLIVCQNVLYILLKRTARRRHSPPGKVIKALLAAVRARDCSLSRNVEVPILRTSTEIAVQIPTH